MATLDWLIIAAYLGAVGGLAAWVFLRRQDTPDDYFLANRNLGWFIVGASIFASNIGSEHLVGLAGSGATDGVALAQQCPNTWHHATCRIIGPTRNTWMTGTNCTWKHRAFGVCAPGAGK